MLLGELLISENILGQGDIDEALARQKVSGGSLGDNLVALNKITPSQLEGVFNYLPPPPKTPQETGLDGITLLSLCLKCVHLRGLELPSQIGAELKLPAGVVSVVLEDAKRRRLADTFGMGGSEVRPEHKYALTEQGRQWTSDAIQSSRYVGPAPVPLEAYISQVERQRIRHERVGPEQLAESFAAHVLPDQLLGEIGPAVNSGRALALWAKPGDGTSTVARDLAAAFRNLVYIPHCISVDGQIIKLFDPSVHRPAPVNASPTGAGDRSTLIRRSPTDERWVRCHRPIVATSTELTPEMFDLHFDEVSRAYDAPLPMKATNGIFIVDDLDHIGSSRADILNRWALLLGRRYDMVRAATGRSYRVPFDQFVVFVSSVEPERVLDQRLMRIVPYKCGIKPPRRAEYQQILADACEKAGVDYDGDIVGYIFDRYYGAGALEPARFHPHFLVDTAIAACRYEGVPVKLEPRLADLAFHHLEPDAEPLALSA